MPLNILFAGTPEFAVPSLEKLCHSRHRVLAVYTQPDRPAGRGQQLHASPVKQCALANAIPVLQPKTLRDETVQAALKQWQPDVLVVVAYGLILPEAVLKIPKWGCVNVHPSLLPRWRGAAPIPRSIEAGDAETGVTIMQLDKGMDTGPILKQEKYHLNGLETSAQLHALFSHRGAELLLETLDHIAEIKPIAQDHSRATHAAKIEKSEAIIDWQQSAVTIQNKVRAFNSWPVANMIFDGISLKVWEAKAITEKTTAKPGELIRFEKDAFFVATGEGVLKIVSVQPSGKKIMSAGDFLRGRKKTC